MKKCCVIHRLLKEKYKKHDAFTEYVDGSFGFLLDGDAIWIKNGKDYTSRVEGYNSFTENNRQYIQLFVTKGKTLVLLNIKNEGDSYGDV